MPKLSPSDNDPNEGELIHRWLDTQRHELQVQSERIALSDKELDHNRALSEKTIDAQLKDRSEERSCSGSATHVMLLAF